MTRRTDNIMSDHDEMDYDNLATAPAASLHDDQPQGAGGQTDQGDPDAALDALAEKGGDLGGAASVAKKTKVKVVVNKARSVKTDEGTKTKVVIDLEVVEVLDAHGDPKLIGQEHSLWCCVASPVAKDVTRGKADLYKAARAAGCPLDPADLRKTQRGAKMTEALVGCTLIVTLAPGTQGGTFVNV
jgi:hypothetical protein